jgi:hypothetical protein
VVIGFGVTVLGRVVSIDRNLSHIGHVGLRGFIFGFGWKMRLKVTEHGENGEIINGREGFFFKQAMSDLKMKYSLCFPSLQMRNQAPMQAIEDRKQK